MPGERLHAPVIIGERARMTDAVLAVARGALRRPSVTWRHARSPSRRRRIMRASTVALGPRLLHAPSLEAARQWQDLAGALGARIVATVRGEEAVDGAVSGRLDAPAGCALHIESRQMAGSLAHALNGNSIAVIDPLPDRELILEDPVVALGRPVRILGVGPLSWTYGYEHSLAAIKLLSDRGIQCQYRIVGTGAYRDAVSFARHQLGLDEQVVLIDPGSRAELRELFRWAELLLDASVAPASPKPIMDANARGIAVLATERDLERGAALFAPRRDAERLADALEDLILDPELVRQLVARGREAAWSAPREADQAARFAELYQQAIGNER